MSDLILIMKKFLSYTEMKSLALQLVTVALCLLHVAPSEKGASALCGCPSNNEIQGQGSFETSPEKKDLTLVKTKATNVLRLLPCQYYDVSLSHQQWTCVFPVLPLTDLKIPCFFTWHPWPISVLDEHQSSCLLTF